MKNKESILLLKLIQKGDKSTFKHLFDTYFSPNLSRFINLYIYLWENKQNIGIKFSLKVYLLSHFFVLTTGHFLANSVFIT